MIKVISGSEVCRHPALFEYLFRLRHRVFVDGMGWTALAKADGLERDQFDGDSAVHVIAVEQGRITAYTRLLPTTGPHLLRDVYPELLAGSSSHARPDVFEWTRLFTDPDERPSGRMGPGGRTLFVAIAEHCARQGLSSLIAQGDPMWITKLLQLGWEARPLALPTVFDGRPVLAFEAHLTPHTVARSRRVLGISGDVFETSDEFALSLLPNPDVAGWALTH